jgi:hypothetical protein
MAACLHCGNPFQPRKAGHVFCSVGCRHGGERRPEERPNVDPELIERLFDPRRDPNELVREDDWHPEPGTGWVALDLCRTVAHRRRWYLTLREEGRL